MKIRIIKIKTIVITFILCQCNTMLAQDKGFYVNADIGLLPYAWMVVSNPDLENATTNEGILVTGVEPSFKLNSQNDISAFLILEGHNKPIPATFAFGAKWRYFLQDDGKTPFVSMALGNGLKNIDNSGSNGIYGATEIGYQWVNKKGKPYRFSLGYSIQSSNDLEIVFDGPTTNAGVHSFKIMSNFTVFRSKSLKNKN